MSPGGIRETDNVLAIDASTEACSVALQLQSTQYSRISYEPRAHAQSLLPMIDEVLREAGVELVDLDCLAVVHGPGSFTGIRIALSILQGLAYGSNLPIVCASSLEVMASACAAKISRESRVLLVPALDARMSEVYWASYDLSKDGDLAECHPPAVTGVQDFVQKIDLLAKDSALICSGTVFGSEKMAPVSSLKVDSACAPSAEALLMALSQFNKPKQSISELEPLYLRNEVVWKKRTRIRGEAIT